MEDKRGFGAPRALSPPAPQARRRQGRISAAARAVAAAEAPPPAATVCSLRRRRGETSAVRTAQRREGECRERCGTRHESRRRALCAGSGNGDVGCAHTRRLLVDKVNVISPSQSEVTRCALQTSPVRDTARTTGAHDRRDTAHRLEQWAAHTATGPQRTVPSPLRLAIAADRSLRVPRSHTASPIGARRRCVRAAQLCSR